MTDRVTNLNPAEFRSKHNSLEERVAALEAALGGAGSLLTFNSDGITNNDTFRYDSTAGEMVVVAVAD